MEDRFCRKMTRERRWVIFLKILIKNQISRSSHTSKTSRYSQSTILALSAYRLETTKSRFSLGFPKSTEPMFRVISTVSSYRFSEIHPVSVDFCRIENIYEYEIWKRSDQTKNRRVCVIVYWSWKWWKLFRFSPISVPIFCVARAVSLSGSGGSNSSLPDPLIDYF